MSRRGKRSVKVTTADPADPRPHSSPYAVQATLTIYCEDGVTLNIPSLFIQRYPKLCDLCSPDTERGGDRISLSEYSEATAHILAHFLCTDQYQCLKPEASSPSQGIASELSASLQVYTMAQVYELEPLEVLAKDEIKRLGAQLEVQKTLTTVLDALNSRKTLDVWLQGYLKSLIAELMEDPPEAPIGDGPHDPNQPMPLTNVLLNSMIELFRERTNTERANSPTFVSFLADNTTVADAETVAQTFVSFPDQNGGESSSRAAARAPSPSFVTCAEDDGGDRSNSGAASAGVGSEVNGHSEPSAEASATPFGLGNSLYQSEIAERKREKNQRRNQRRKERKMMERQAGHELAGDEAPASGTGTDWSDRVETESLQELMSVHSKYGIQG